MINRMPFRIIFMPSIIRCSKHGRVEGPYCKICRTEKYLAKVKAGKLEPKILEEEDQLDSDFSPLQIRWRAFKQRSKREDAKIGKDVYPWQRKVRIPTEYSFHLKRRR